MKGFGVRVVQAEHPRQRMRWGVGSWRKWGEQDMHKAGDTGRCQLWQGNMGSPWMPVLQMGSAAKKHSDREGKPGEKSDSENQGWSWIWGWRWGWGGRGERRGLKEIKREKGRETLREGGRQQEVLKSPRLRG